MGQLGGTASSRRLSAAQCVYAMGRGRRPPLRRALRGTHWGALWRWFPRWLALVVAAVAALLVVMVLTSASARGRPRRPPPHRRILPPEQRQLRTRWNLTCPAPNASKSGIARVAVADDEEQPLFDVVECAERETWQRRERRGAHWLLAEHAPALLQPPCWGAVTLATHGDLPALAGLGALVRRWRAPVSLALHAPGDDLLPALAAVSWARACLEPPLVAQHVTFHLLLDAAHLPDAVPPPPDLSAREEVDCSAEEAPWVKAAAAGTYRWKHDLRYPVNVARNAARSLARTFFVLVSDLELLPSVGLSDAFLAMVSRKMTSDKVLERRVFVLPVFEVQLGVQPPEDKSQLLALLRAGKAAPFHEEVCHTCHAIPQPQRWVCAPRRTDGALGITAITRRQGAYRNWEAIYIGTDREPLYDERLSWEGMSDKQVQSYTMCLLDYQFYVLDDAFLVHQPGVKAPNSDGWRYTFVRETQQLIESTIKPELTKLYGHHRKCYL